MNTEVDTTPHNMAAYPLLPSGVLRSRSFLTLLGQLAPVLALLAVSPLAMRSLGGQRALLAASLFLVLYALRASASGFLLALIYISFLGGLRRNLIPILGWSGTDPLLLICPAIASLYFLGKAFQRRIPLSTSLSRAVCGLLVLMTAQIFNPMQGGLEIGLIGALFYIAPLLWFYAGNDLGTPALLRRMLWVLVGIGIISALYGSYQYAYGLTPGEQQWINEYAYIAAKVNTTIRIMAFSTNSVEWAQLLMIATVVLWAAFLRGNFVALLPIPFFVLGIFLQGSRTPVAMTIFVCTLLWAIQGRRLASWAPRGLLALVLGIGGLAWSLQQAQNHSFDDRTSQIVSHQAGGLLHPMDEKESTVGVHSSLIHEGLVAGLSNPIGRGLGSTSPQAEKFGGQGANSEMDLTNVFIALGIFGGLLYAIIIALVLIAAFRQWHRERSLESLALLGILVSMLGYWLNGGQYAISMLMWFCIGALNHRIQRDRTQQEPASQKPASQEQVACASPS